MYAWLVPRTPFRNATMYPSLRRQRSHPSPYLRLPVKQHPVVCLFVKVSGLMLSMSYIVFFVKISRVV